MQLTATLTKSRIEVTTTQADARPEDILDALAQRCHDEQVLGNLHLYVGHFGKVYADLNAQFDFDYEAEKCERVRLFCCEAINLGADEAQELADDRAELAASCGEVQA
jgi:hypothetical protein